jgi:hypothetical protein
LPDDDSISGDSIAAAQHSTEIVWILKSVAEYKQAGSTELCGRSSSLDQGLLIATGKRCHTSQQTLVIGLVAELLQACGWNGLHCETTVGSEGLHLLLISSHKFLGCQQFQYRPASGGQCFQHSMASPEPAALMAGGQSSARVTTTLLVRSSAH